MATKQLLNYLELAYSPLTNYDFATIKTDPLFQQLAEDSSLYIIAQQKELTMDDFRIVTTAEDPVLLRFKIKQKGSTNELNCQLPVFQKRFATDKNRNIKFHFTYALPKPDLSGEDLPVNNLHSVLLHYHDDEFIGWLTPETFIQNYLNGARKGTMTGPLEDFIKYKVLYVGKATDQQAWKRLTGHSTLQDILSLEVPQYPGTLPTNEIAVIFLKIKEAIGLHTIRGKEDITQDAVDTILGKNQPTGKIISLDAEKALINAMQPKYNKQFYKNYPASKDGLQQFNLDSYSFQITSHIILEYENGIIRGRPDFEADSIYVEKDKPLQIFNR